MRDAAERLSAGYASPKEFFEKRIAEGVATIAAAFYPKKVIVRMSDFKSNEYRKLIGGALYEPDEENPMLGFRGASRYISNQFAECFAMECRAMKFVRDEMGLTNVELMIPFVRTLNEAKRVNEIMEQYGLKRGVQRPSPQHDVRNPVQRASSPTSSSSTSTASPSARTT